MKTLFVFFQFTCMLFLLAGCKHDADKKAAQTKVNIHLPVTSANVVFHIKDNKMTSYEILNVDGTAITEQVIYREVNKDGKEVCYRCAPGQTDTRKCTVIQCPKDPCKEIYCGPLNFQLVDNSTSSTTDNPVQFSIVADGLKE